MLSHGQEKLEVLEYFFFCRVEKTNFDEQFEFKPVNKKGGKLVSWTFKLTTVDYYIMGVG